MAKLSQGINGAFSGKVGAVVGYTWKGIPVMRGRPSARTKPFTPKELNQQAKFRIMNRFLRPANSLLNVTFAHLAVRMSAFNKAFSYNIKNAISGVAPNLAIDYTMALISRGDLPNADSPAVTSLSAGLLQFTWTDNSGKGKAKGTDKAFVAVFQEESGSWDYRVDITTRSQGKCEMEMKNFPSKPVQTFIGFISADGKDASDSLYTGLANV
jgi:Family of unknown function (DUF6266)